MKNKVMNEELFGEQVRHFCDLLHGSGINSDWKVERKVGHIILKNSYHCMDEYGYYDQRADFWIKLFEHIPEEFELHFTGRVSHHMNNKYGLREYLEDTITHFVEYIWTAKGRTKMPRVAAKEMLHDN